MPTVGKIAIAMVASTEGLSKGFKASQAMLATFTSRVQESTGIIKGLFAGAMGAGAAAGIAKTISAASSLSDTVKASEATFGSASATIIAEADKQAAAFGVSKRSFIDAATSFGSMMQGAGQSAADATKLGNSLAKLGMDMARMKGAKTEEVFGAMSAALRGEFDPLERFNVFLKATDVETRALAMGLAKSSKELTDGAKKMATMALITEQTSKAQGYFAKNAGTASALTEAFWGRVENLSASLGEKLLPIATSVMSEMNTALTVVSNLWQSTGSAAVNSAMSSIGAMAQTGQSVGILQRSIGFVVDAWDTMRLGFQAVQSYITGGLAHIVDGLAGLGSAIDFAVSKLTGFKSGIGDYLKTFGDDLHRLSGEQWAGFQKELAKPWPSTGIDAMFKDAQAKTAALQKAMGATPSALTAKTGVASSAAGSKSQTRFASAMEAGSRESVNAILRSRYGSGLEAKGPEQQTAKNTAKTNELLSKIATSLGSSAGAGVGRAVFGNF